MNGLNASLFACSVLYYTDKGSGHIYVANNEDYWYDVKPYIRIVPRSKKTFAHLWYGWNGFSQGGVNEAGLFFDGAITPPQKIPEGFGKPKGNIGDDILGTCTTVDDALAYLQLRKIALTDAHMIFGDSSGKAVVVEWVDGVRRTTFKKSNRLIITNFLISDTAKGNYPCLRYNAINNALDSLEQKKDSINLRSIGNAIAKAVQIPQTNDKGKVGGTLYSTFIDITNKQFIIVPKLDNTKMIKLNLQDEFNNPKERKIQLP
jgi:choloylglycine hydrolase